MSESSESQKDWSKINSKAHATAFQKAAYFHNELVKEELRNFPNDTDSDRYEKWSSDFFNKKHRSVYYFSREYCSPGFEINIGKTQYAVEKTFSSFEMLDKERANVILVKDKEGNRKILKRLSPNEALDFFLNAAELQDNGIDTGMNARLLRLENPWMDTVMYDFIPGESADDWILNPAREGLSEVSKKRLDQVLHYFDTTVVPLARGRLLKGGRAYLPADFNPGAIIVSNPEGSTPKFSLIDLMGAVSNDSVPSKIIRFARQNFIENIDIIVEQENIQNL